MGGLTLFLASEYDILNVNLHFAQIIGRGNIEECKNLKISTLFFDKADYEKFRFKLRENLLRNHPIEFISLNGDKREVIVNAKILRSKESSSIRFVGSVYDVTDDIQRKLSNWHRDFASFLHSHSAMSNNIRDTLRGILSAHSTNAVQDERLKHEIALERIEHSIKSLTKNMGPFLTLALERALIDQASINTIFEKLDLLKTYNKNDKLETALTRYRILSIRDIINNKSILEKLPKEKTRNIFNDIGEILRYTRLISISTLIDEIGEMLIDIDTFKEALKSDSIDYHKTQLDLNEVVKSVIRELDQYAERRAIKIKLHSNTATHNVNSNSRQLFVALYNILHNAIKYSWSKSEEKSSWVNVKINEGNFYSMIEIENRGVAITEEEIKSGDIFQFGYRGKKSTDRHRIGSGIGLWHSRKVISYLGGSIDIKSKPVGYNLPNDYSNPFITTVIIKIPNS